MFLLFKDRIAVESNRLVCNATRPKEVSDSFRYQDNNLERTSIKNRCFGTLPIVELDNQAHHGR